MAVSSNRGRVDSNMCRSIFYCFQVTGRLLYECCLSDIWRFVRSFRRTWVYQENLWRIINYLRGDVLSIVLKQEKPCYRYHWRTNLYPNTFQTTTINIQNWNLQLDRPNPWSGMVDHSHGPLHSIILQNRASTWPWDNAQKNFRQMSNLWNRRQTIYLSSRITEWDNHYTSSHPQAPDKLTYQRVLQHECTLRAVYGEIRHLEIDDSDGGYIFLRGSTPWD